MTHDARTSDHLDGKRFFNPGGAQAKGFLDVLRWKLRSSAGAGSPASPWPLCHPPPARVEGDRVRVTFINHSTALLQYRGLNILTDPVWSERASPLSWVGPRRHRPPGFDFHDLPSIDVVLISHNHYDHLDASVIRRLVSRDDPEF